MFIYTADTETAGEGWYTAHKQPWAFISSQLVWLHKGTEGDCLFS